MAESSSILSFHLKCFRGRLRRVLIVGSVNVRIVDLLDQCNNEQHTSLSLDNRTRRAGLLIVHLQEAVASIPRGVTAKPAVSNVNIQAQASDAPHLLSERSPIEPATPEQDLDHDVVESLGRVVHVIKTVVEKSPETSELRPYANIAWRVMSLAYNAAQEHNERARTIRDIVVSMMGLYSNVDVDKPKRAIRNIEDVMIKIAVQTIECGIFIHQYTFNMAPQSISETQEIVSNLAAALSQLEAALGSGLRSSRFVSARASWDANEQVLAMLKAKLDPADMDMAYRETCLPETRVDILRDLFISLTIPDPSHNIIWLHGPAGSGKSTILNTLSQCFIKLHRRGAVLFWDRNDPVNSDLRRVIHTLAYQLACFNTVFADALASSVTAEPNIMKSSLNEQFQCLVQEPCDTLMERHVLGPIIVIFDAVDECGTTETRQRLLDVLFVGLAKLPNIFRFLIASRDEPEIRDSISRIDIDERDVPTNDESTRSDISQFFQRRLVRPTLGGYRLPSGWPGDQVIKQLVDLAQGLFIWASTSVRFIESGVPQDRLKKVLDATALGEPHRKLDHLYHIALVHPFNTYDRNELDAVQSILGVIAVARKPLTDEHLSQLLELELGVVQGILSRLRPLLQWSEGKPAQPLHASFTDFLCDSTRCDPQWHIDACSHHNNLASLCFRVMLQDLRFNICGIESSHQRHLEIEGIQERINQVVTPLLMYVSEHWADHLELGTSLAPDSNLMHGATEFIKNKLLYWIEVFSLKNQMSRIFGILHKAVDWAKKYAAELEAVLSEASKFVNAFGYPISQSVPHIYLSALPFLPSESAVLRHAQAAFKNTLSVERGTSKLWPAIRQTFTRHSDWVTSVAFSHDSSRVVSGSYDGTVRIWDVVSGAPNNEPLQRHLGRVRSVSFSPDGTQVVSSSGRAIQTWDAGSGAPIGKPLHGHCHYVSSVAYSTDGTRIASGSRDKTVRIWDAMSGAPICGPLEGHSGSVWSVAFSPDGTRIASGSSDNTIRMWDAAAGTLIGEPLRGHSGIVRSVAFSPNGTLFVSGSEDRTIRIWDALSGVQIGEPLRGHALEVYSVTFSSDSTHVISGSRDLTIQTWDANSGASIGTSLRGHSDTVWSVACSRDGTRIASGSFDGTVRVWGTLPSMPPSDPLQQQHIDAVWSVAYSPDGTRIVSGSDDRTVRIWDAVTGASIGEPLKGHTDKIWCVAISPDGKRIVSGSQDRTVRIWDAISGAPIHKTLKGHSRAVTSVAYSPDGTRIVSGSVDKTLRVWDAMSGTPIGNPLQGHNNTVLSLAHSPDSTRIVSASDDIWIWDALLGTPVGQLQGDFALAWCVAYSPGGTRVVSGHDYGGIQIWDAVSHKPIGKPLHGHLGAVRSVAFSPGDVHLVSGSSDNTVRIWDVASGAPISEPLQGHSDMVISVAFSPDGTRIVSSSCDETIRIWDAPRELAIGSTGHGSFVLKETSSRKTGDPDSTPIFTSDIMLHSDGWLTTSNGQLLFWIPPEQRLGVVLPPALFVIGAQPTRINLGRFVHGTCWTLCRTDGS